VGVVSHLDRSDRISFQEGMLRMMSKPLASVLFPIILVAASPVRREMLVSTEWLAQHLSDPKIVILHVGRDRGIYDAGHIPGARYVALTDIAITRDGVLNELPPVAVLKHVFEQVGVSDDTRVILYSDDLVLPATRAFYTLDYVGHGDHTALLDGGLGKWTKESRPMSNEVPVVGPARLTLRVMPHVVVELQAMKRLSSTAAENQTDSAVLLDVRPAEDFKGLKAASVSGREGHIPGAVNMHWTELQASRGDSTLKSLSELQAIFHSLGASANRRVVTYCNSGVSASHTYFTLRYLGYNVGMYDGSYSEWQKANDAPVVK
jgi:thiosulfate/3-mercaptopyruvate sulfurtransferase